MNTKSPIVQGTGILLLASVFWGLGNALVGLTAQKYLVSGLFPAIDIALSNTLGGIFFITMWHILKIKSTNSTKENFSIKRSINHYFHNKKALLGGALKGANSALFVLSATYIMATQAVVFESTYIVWSLIFTIIFYMRKVPAVSSVLKVVLLFTGIIFVSGQTTWHITSEYFYFGAIFGLLAGVTYASYLLFWSFVSKDLENPESQRVSTIFLLSIAFVTIIVLSEIVGLVLLHKLRVPFSSLEFGDMLLQFFNGVMVMGIVYLLVTIGMNKVKRAREGANYIAAICLSFSIPFTLFIEFLVGKFIPTWLQLIGLLFFMIGFVLMSITLSNNTTDNDKVLKSKERDMIYIKELPNKCRGVVAKIYIKKGTLIESAPTVSFSPEDREIIKKTQLFGHYFVKSDEYIRGKPCKGYLVFGLISLCNHSDNPNAYVKWIETDTWLWAYLIATKDIEPGEEITLYYINIDEYSNISEFVP